MQATAGDIRPKPVQLKPAIKDRIDAQTVVAARDHHRQRMLSFTDKARETLLHSGEGLGLPATISVVDERGGGLILSIGLRLLVAGA